MFWRQPAAWFGLVALAVPILVHLLGRRPPKPLRFPTLRFLDVSTIVPARRHRLNDVAAAHRPPGDHRRGGLLRWPGRCSGRRASRLDWHDRPRDRRRHEREHESAWHPMAGRPPMAARERAQSLTAGASTSRVIDGDALGPAVAAAAGWLADETGRREIVVISDFQRGALRADRPRAA